MATQQSKLIFKQIPDVLAVLIAESRAYTYTDKLGYAPTKDLALFYIKEALRDFHSLLNQGRWNNSKAQELATSIKMSYVESEVEKVADVSSLIELREVVCLITAKALARAAELLQTKINEKKE
jgi:CRISPR-associated protein Csa5